MIWLCWLIVYSGGRSGESDDEGGSRVSWGDVYKGSAELVLVLLSDLYLLLELIFVGISGLFFYPTSHCLLTTFLRKDINNFGLRRLFYSK